MSEDWETIDDMTRDIQDLKHHPEKASEVASKVKEYFLNLIRRIEEGGCEEDGYEEGYEDGYREGYNKGHEEGRQELLAELQNDVYIPSEVRARLRCRY